MTHALILIAVLCTSTISGVVGMAGGMILMAVLVMAMSVPAAMMLHGVTQAASNGSRAFFLRKHITWSILPPYLLGCAIAAIPFAVFRFVPDENLVLLLIGSTPWLGRLLPGLRGLNVTHFGTAIACGMSVTAAQLLAGASGPLLDIFYLRSPLNRHQIIASKAITQAVGHLVKLVYYGLILSVLSDQTSAEAPAWLMAAAVATALLGTRIGTWILEHLNEDQFRRYSTRVIMGIGAACMLKGGAGMLGV